VVFIFQLPATIFFLILLKNVMIFF
jgi:hypothetical protein